MDTFGAGYYSTSNIGDSGQVSIPGREMNTDRAGGMWPVSFGQLQVFHKVEA